MYLPIVKGEKETVLAARLELLSANSFNVSLPEVDTERYKEIQHVFLSGAFGKEFISTLHENHSFVWHTRHCIE